MKRKWVEVICDACGNADHYRPGRVDELARENGWIVARDGLHFCGKPCRDAYKKQNKGRQADND